MKMQFYQLPDCDCVHKNGRGYTDISKRQKAHEGRLKWQGGHKMKIQYTSYCVTVWIDSGKAYTAATEKEAREMLEEDSGKE